MKNNSTVNNTSRNGTIPEIVYLRSVLYITYKNAIISCFF